MATPSAMTQGSVSEGDTLQPCSNKILLPNKSLDVNEEGVTLLRSKPESAGLTVMKEVSLLYMYMYMQTRFPSRKGPSLYSYMYAVHGIHVHVCYQGFIEPP